MKINYLINDNGSDLWLVFLHGAGGNLYAWDSLRDELHQEGFSTLAIDLRGHGDSFRPPKRQDYYLNEFAEDIKTVLEKENITNFILVGHCFGGTVANLYEYKYRKATGIVMIGSSDRSPLRLKALWPLMYILDKFFFNYLPDKNRNSRKDFAGINTSDFSPRRILDDIANTSPKSYLATFYRFSFFEGSKMLSKIDCPTLIISGENDTIFGPKYGKRLTNLIKNSEFKEIKDGGHMIILDETNKICKYITEFASSLEKKIK